MSETHVGLIGDLPAPTPVQRSKLAYALASIALGHSGQLTVSTASQAAVLSTRPPPLLPRRA